MKFSVGLLLLSLVFTLAPMAGAAQDARIDPVYKNKVIDRVLNSLLKNYVFPEVAREMEKDIKRRMAAGEYESIAEGPALAGKLTSDLQFVSRDSHLRVSYSPQPIPNEPEGITEPTPELLEQLKREFSRDNFGCAEVRILRGNVGYLKFNYFLDPKIAGDTYTGALNFIANTDALIIDLRSNGGSMSPDAIPMICSYFFDRPTHLNDLYWRPTDSTRQYWTWNVVPGQRYLNKPIYVLTSGRTFSGAEEFAYDLKNLKRATIVGDITGGGAHGGGDTRIDDHFSVWVPYGRAINPITKTNWEGTGVSPDIAVPAARALKVAHLEALRLQLATLKDDKWKATLKTAIDDISNENAALKQVTFTLKGYPEAKSVSLAGSFNFWAWRSTPMSRAGEKWTVTVELEPGRHTYKFVVDGKWIIDPDNPRTEIEGPNTNSLRVVE